VQLRLSNDDTITEQEGLTDKATFSNVVLGSLTYATKIGLKTLSLTATVGSCACMGTSYTIAGLSYPSYQLACMLEGQVKDAASYRVTTFFIIYYIVLQILSMLHLMYRTQLE
jgi:hypothetical protein